MNRAAVTKRILTLEEFVYAFDEFVRAGDSLRAVNGRTLTNNEERAAKASAEARFEAAQHNLGRRRRLVGGFTRFVP